MSRTITIHDKEFEPFITAAQLQSAVHSLAQRIINDYQGKKPVFVVVLNGAFMFASDLMKCIPIECEIVFVRVKSYEGMQSTGAVNEVLGLDIPLKDRDVLLVEDIIDSGLTLDKLRNRFIDMGATSVKIVSCLLKPSSFKKNYPIDYLCFSIPNDFVVGYGLDYDELGRNYPEIYKVV